MGADQGVTPEGPAVHHADVQGRVQELILREVLGVGPGSLSSEKGKKRTANKNVCVSPVPGMGPGDTAPVAPCIPVGRDGS